MGAPRPFVSSNSLSVGITVRLVVIQSLITGQSDSTANLAVCTDKTGFEVRVPLYTARAKGRLPAVGEQWLIAQDVGTTWSFAAFFGTGPDDFLAEPSDIDLPALTTSLTPAMTTAALTALAPGPWDNFNPLSNSWSVPSGGYAKYRLWPAVNVLEISAWIKSPGSSQVNSVTIATFPSGFRPASTHGFAVAADLLPASINQSPMMTITSGGVMQAQGVGGNPGNANVYFNVRLPLDV